METNPAPLANVITLGVRNLAAERDFYRGLGWPQLDSDVFAAFELRGAVLALFPVENLAAESHLPAESGRGAIRFRVAVIVERPEDVDELADRVRVAGGTVTREPADADFYEGRSAYFSDPEGFCWRLPGPHQTTLSSPPRVAQRAQGDEAPRSIARLFS